MIKLITIPALLIVLYTSLVADELSFRKYEHVKQFYKEITMDAMAVAKKHKLPAATILAIAGLESGYGSGYVSKITGNVLSLGAFKGDQELPILYLPYSKSQKTVLFDPSEIKKCSTDDLSWKTRPKSYKRDYRPIPYAGSTKNLELLTYDKDLKRKAYKACLDDFATRWIIKGSRVKVFKEARLWLDDIVSKKSTDILFSMSANRDFIYMIGGHDHSYNYRKTWPKKVELIMKKAGLVQLINDIHNKNMSFEEAWSNI